MSADCAWMPRHLPPVIHPCRVYIVDDPAGLARLANDHALLDADEQARAGRLRRTADRELWCAAHVLLRRALSCHGPLAPARWRYRRAAHGRPELAAPCQALAGDLRFSLSHTPGLVCCAIAHGVALGVDAERHRAGRNAVALAQRFFRPDEAALVAAAGHGGSLADPFHALWVLKEAHLKAIGLGIAGGLERFGFQFGAGTPATITVTDTGDTTATWRAALLSGAAGDWSLALAVGAAQAVQVQVHLGTGAADAKPPQWRAATDAVAPQHPNP